MKNHNSAGYYSLTGHAPPTDDQRLRDSRELFPAYGSVVDRFAPAASGHADVRVVSATSSPTARSRRASTRAFSARRTIRSSSSRIPNSRRLPPAGIELARRHHDPSGCKIAARCMQPDRPLDRHARDFGARRGIDAHYDRALTMLTQPDVSPGVRPVERTGRRCATATAARPTARAACSRGGSSKSASSSSPSTSPRRSAASERVGRLGHARLQRRTRCIRSSTITCCRSPTRRCRRCSTICDAARPARRHAGRLGGRIRPHAAHQQHRGPRPLAAVLHGAAGRRRRQAAATSTASATASARIRRATPVRPEDLSATMFHLLGIDPHAEVRDALESAVAVSTGNVIEGILKQPLCLRMTTQRWFVIIRICTRRTAMLEFSAGSADPCTWLGRGCSDLVVVHVRYGSSPSCWHVGRAIGSGVFCSAIERRSNRQLGAGAYG